MFLDPKKLERNFIKSCLKKIPKEDFISCEYDIENQSEITDILIIFSTPRSGSTFLSELLFRSGLCLPHEYFQPFQYLPILAERWNAIENLTISKEKFIEALIKYRTSEKGWLGINLHGEHLAEFNRYRDYFPNVNWHCIYLYRQNTIKQAISLDVAFQNKKWTKFFDEKAPLKYSYNSIYDKLIRINKQNNLIQSYLNSFYSDIIKISYENLISNPIPILSDALPAITLSDNSVKSVNIEKQKDILKQQWNEQFSKDYFDKEKLKTHLTDEKVTIKGKIFKILSRRKNSK